jgi:hypothetical protein
LRRGAHFREDVVAALLGLKLAVFAGLLAWWLARDRVDFRPVLSPPRWRLFAPVGVLLIAAAAAGFSAFGVAIGMGVVGLGLLCSYPLRQWRLSPVGIEAGCRTLRWEDVTRLQLRGGAVELMACDGSRLLLPRDLDGMVTFSRVARVALPAAVSERPQAQWLLARLESGGDPSRRPSFRPRPGEPRSLVI